MLKNLSHWLVGCVVVAIDEVLKVLYQSNRLLRNQTTCAFADYHKHFIYWFFKMACDSVYWFIGRCFPNLNAKFFYG